ncbi:MAG: DUF547 domain-containing protein [Ignavibacteria bacterium]|nr:DUF547 domain-containing protein [Ignavibacteria bacterium]MBT8380756.1 DUF547 domain-containing protein [Ignavibacteria bacterium]MBT8390273.1 DUF547 domain-containing protein [Ignavibacteria bacterium]NNJ53205.1 DUF547 domain-containing protein [Ignavibacteriaceae bacterium]NNL22314.1 DUF547 domain-containing protein [Ignavibacteriaceae bacterium]
MKRIILIITNIILITACTTAKSGEIDHSILDKLLKENVNDKGMIDYKAFQNNKIFEKYLNQIASADISELNNIEKLAFFINAYNALTIKNVLNHYPINSPMDVEGFFKKKKFAVAGMEITLDKLEYDYVLPINSVLPHFGLVCAAVSCPKLLKKAYTSKTVLHQLEENAKAFLNDKTKNRLDREAKVLYLSSIFKWFKKYFEQEYSSLIETAKMFLNDDDKKFLKENEVEIKFIKYNWKLNTQ